MEPQTNPTGISQPGYKIRHRLLLWNPSGEAVYYSNLGGPMSKENCSVGHPGAQVRQRVRRGDDGGPIAPQPSAWPVNPVVSSRAKQNQIGLQGQCSALQNRSIEDDKGQYFDPRDFEKNQSKHLLTSKICRSLSATKTADRIVAT